MSRCQPQIRWPITNPNDGYTVTFWDNQEEQQTIWDGQNAQPTAWDLEQLDQWQPRCQG